MRVTRAALRSESELFLVVVICNYNSGPITETIRAKAEPLHVRRSCFGPATRPGLLSEPGFLVEPPGTAPGSDPLIMNAIYRHSRKTGSTTYRRKPLKMNPATPNLIKFVAELP